MIHTVTDAELLEMRKACGKEDAVFRDVREKPFRLYGLPNNNEPENFFRMPAEVAESVNDGVKAQNKCTSGVRVRFTTDASYVAIYCKVKAKRMMSHMPVLGVCGFDLYIDDPMVGGRTPTSRFVNSFQPPVDFQGYYSKVVGLPAGSHSYTLNFPLYNPVDELYIGLPEGASLLPGIPYVNEKPIVYYGSSITQGGVASRPGLAFPGIISRRLNADFRNLGFSGSARAEETMLEYLKQQEMCMFVSDYDHNAPSLEHLRATHYKLYEAVRTSHPDIPILLISRPDFHYYSASGTRKTFDSAARRDVIIDTFRKARENGDKLVWFIDGEGFFSGPDETECTSDGTHPNDIGMLKMADNIHRVILRVLNEVPFLKA